MTTAAVVADLFAYSLRLALVLGVGLGLPRLLALRQPLVRLRYFRGLLLCGVLLPLVPSWPLPQAAAGLAGGAQWFGEVVVTAAPQPAAWPWNAVLAVLAAGAGLRLARLAFGLRALGRFRREARPLPGCSPAVGELRRRLAAGAEIARHPRLASPLTFGWRRPIVLLPEAFDELPPPAQAGVACHELLHVARHDWRARLWEEVAGALLWFHPAVAVLRDRIALCREQVVDGDVVRLTGARRPYLEALCRFARGPETVPGPALSLFHRSHLVRRVAHLLEETPMNRTTTPARLGLLAVLTAFTLTLAGIAFPMAGLADDGAADQEVREGAVEVEGDVVPPERLTSVVPSYTEATRKEKVEGKVVIQVVIDEEGKVRAPRILQSLHDELDKAALDAVSQWTFAPATLDGKPVKVLYNLTINFRLS